MNSPLPVGGIPPFHLARVALEGEVLGDRAVITAQIDVDVNRNLSESHDVPLRLTQAHVLSKQYDGPGQEGPVLDGPAEDGIVWRFTGSGTHKLQLKMWVPIRHSAAGRQLVLSLPTMPPGFDAHLHLKIPGVPVVIRTNRDLSVLANDAVDQVNEITADVRGQRLDLTWSEPPEFQTAFLQATTSFTLRREGDRVLATAEQILLPENVGVKEAEIKLPDGFELEELSGPFLKGHEAILGRTGWRRLSFRETSGERIELNWVLSSPFSATGGTLQFDGLVVPDARSQTGRIRLQDFPGYQMVPRPGEFVRRIPATAPQTAEVFEYTKQPFRIAWDVQRVSPRFSVRPRHVLFVGTDQLRLESRFRVQTDIGSLDQVDVGWDAADAVGWRLDPAAMASEFTVSPEGDRLSQTGRLLLDCQTPQSGVFEFSVRFVKPLPSGMKASRVSLPVVRNARSQPVDLLVAAEDQLAVELRGVGGTTFLPAASDPRSTEGLSPSLLSQIQRTVQLDPEHLPLDVTWDIQPRQVTADTELELRRAPDGRVRVMQTMRMRVQYGRLSSVRFQLPKSLASLIPAGAAGSAVRVTIDGQPVVPQIREEVVEVPLREPRLGDILVELEYSLPTLSDSSSTTTVPVLNSLDAKSSTVRIRIPEGEPLRIPANAEGWQLVPTSPDATVWVADSPTQVPVVLDANQTTSPRFSVKRAFYRTRLDQTGRVEGVCELQWAGDVRGLPVTLPPDSELLGVLYNGKALDAALGQVVANAAIPSQILFRFPPAPEESRLALWYRSSQAIGFSHRDIRTIPLPQLPPDVLVVRSLWELELPAGRHLFMGPEELTPEHQWKRTGLYWSRTPGERNQAERHEATREARQLTSLPDLSQVYAFSSIGPIVAPRFQTMTRSLILLLGAGLTLAMGFLFWSLPVTRNMLALLLIAFAVSLLSLWFLEPIQLLMQPAVLGAVLAVLASLIDLKSRRSVFRGFPPVVIPLPTSISVADSGEPHISARGSSVSRSRNTPLPLPPTALYQPDHSEAGRP